MTSHHRLITIAAVISLVAVSFTVARHRSAPLVVGQISSRELSEITSACRRLESRALPVIVTFRDIPDYLRQWFATKYNRIESVEAVTTNSFRVNVRWPGDLRSRYRVWCKDGQWDAAMTGQP